MGRLIFLRERPAGLCHRAYEAQEDRRTASVGRGTLRDLPAPAVTGPTRRRKIATEAADTGRTGTRATAVVAAWRPKASSPIFLRQPSPDLRGAGRSPGKPRDIGYGARRRALGHFSGDIP
jgi:hypothetical protein